MGRKAQKGTPRVRLGTEAIVDEQGLHWDRVRSGDTFYASQAEVDQHLPQTVRFLRTFGYGSPAMDVSREEFISLRRTSERVLIFSARGETEQRILTIDMSDC